MRGLIKIAGSKFIFKRFTTDNPQSLGVGKRPAGKMARHTGDLSHLVN